MKVLTPRYSKEEFARRGDEIYDRDIKPHVTAEDDGKFVVIDIERVTMRWIVMSLSPMTAFRCAS